MKEYHLHKGLDLPVAGQPVQEIDSGPHVRTVGLLGRDYLGLKPRVFVQPGDAVGAGTALFAHKDSLTAPITSPLTGRVVAVNRGYRRRLVSVVIEADTAAAEPVDFGRCSPNDTATVAEKIAAAGLWGAFRTRPYSKVPAPGSVPAALFVTATDSEPLAADPAPIIAEAGDAFVTGLEAVAALFDGPTYLCCKGGDDIPGRDVAGVTAATFSGPHPAGLAGTHMHFLHPPTAESVVWSIGYQDIIAIGRLLQTGFVDAERVVSVAGPLVKTPRLVRTVAGTSLRDLMKGQYDEHVASRVISGSILSGYSSSDEGENFLGRYARQVTVIEEDRQQNFLGWLRPMAHKYAVQPVLGSALKRRPFALTSNLNGGRRAMVPLGTFEQLMPQDYLPTQLVRALLVMDTDVAQALGALELDEEDLALLGFACPAKYEYGIALRDCLTKIEKDG
ncbi:MAG: Na(+)-translocating NADH-quinone reductase subunit A [Pseudomonadota bacterium]